MPSNKRQWVLRVLLLLTLGFIWGNSLLPVRQSLSFSDASAHWLSTFLDPDSPIARFLLENVRKIAHFAEFSLLGVELCLLKGARSRTLCGAAQTLSAGLWIAVADEALQMISARGPRISDVLIDLGGVVHGMLWVLACTALWQYVRQKRTAAPCAAFTETKKGE